MKDDMFEKFGEPFIPKDSKKKKFIDVTAPGLEMDIMEAQARELGISVEELLERSVRKVMDNEAITEITENPNARAPILSPENEREN